MRRKNRLAAVGACALLAILTALPAAAAADVRVAGFLPFGFHESTPHRMAIDSSTHRGYYLTGSLPATLWVYDLVRLRTITHKPIDLPAGPFAVDEDHHRIYYAPAQPVAECEQSFLSVLDTASLQSSRLHMPCDAESGAAFSTRGVSYYGPANRLIVIGQTGLRNTTVIRQLSPASSGLHVDWQAELPAVCASSANLTTAPEPVAARTAGGVVSYCYSGGQGRALWIPLNNNVPRRDATGRPITRVSPTVGGQTVPMIDERTGRVLIFEDVPPYGPAVYVYDAERERFDGAVLTGAPAPADGRRIDSSRGFDSVNGRSYVLNWRGLSVADVRARPFAAGESFPILQRGNHVAAGPISIDGRLRRLFLPYPNRGGFVVVQDNRLLDANGSAEPRAGTVDVAERAGVTGRTYSSAASVFATRAVIARGRELYTGAASLDTGSESGFTAATAMSTVIEGNSAPAFGVRCGDYTGQARGAESAPPGGNLWVTCNAASAFAEALAETSGTTLVPASVTIGSSTTRAVTRLTPAGFETIAQATVSDVKIGAVLIGTITTTATTVAHGRTGTAATTFSTSMLDMRAPDAQCSVCRPAQVADAINRLAGSRLRARAPPGLRFASPHGHQAVIENDPSPAASGRAVGDYDSTTATALELVVSNDSASVGRDGSGRSSTLISLAGVEAESRYGIFLIPRVRPGSLPAGVRGLLRLPANAPKPAAAHPSFESAPAKSTPTTTARQVVRLPLALIAWNSHDFGNPLALCTLLAVSVYLSICCKYRQPMLRAPPLVARELVCQLRRPEGVEWFARWPSQWCCSLWD